MSKFPITPVEDWIIIERINILSKDDIIAKKIGLVDAKGRSPKNIMDIERKKASEIVTYEDAENELLKKYDEHPWQAVVIAIGRGRYINSSDRIRMPDISVGDRIVIRGRVGEPIISDHKLYWAIKPHEIFGIIVS